MANIIALLQAELNKFNANMVSVAISTSDIVFEERINMLCFHCKNYNVKFTCPPKFPKLDYRKIFKEEYHNAMFVSCSMPFNENNYQEVRSTSTVSLQRALLHLERFLFENSHSLALSLIGGSCKLCKTGCPPDKCNNPYSARIPMEALGINVVTTAKNIGIELKFPVKTSITRCGLLFW